MPAEREHALVVDVARWMRAAGAPVGPDAAMAAVAAIAELSPPNPDDLYWAMRLAFPRRKEDLPIFEAAFAAVVRAVPPREPEERSGPSPGSGPPAQRSGSEPDVASAAGREDGDGAAADDQALAPSDVEVLRHRDFALYDEADWRRLCALLQQRMLVGPVRRSRRRVPAPRGRLDMGRTIRASLRTGGVPLDRRHRARRIVPRPVVFLCDVSGSMRAYARAMLQLAHAVALQRRMVEAFAFATRLTRLTPLLRERDPVTTERRIRAALPDWSGGTRIGEALETLRREHVHQLRGAVVVLASDGWERGDPQRLAAGAEWLGRMAHAVVWVSPRLSDPDYEPLTRGLAAALPHADRFEPGHDLASLEALLAVLEGYAVRGPRRRRVSR